jgi:hypothetical protein
MPNIFSRPSFHFGDNRNHRRNFHQIFAYARQIDRINLMGLYNRDHPDYGISRLRYLRDRQEEILTLMLNSSTICLLGLVVDSGLLARAKRIANFLSKENCRVNRLSQDKRIKLTRILTLADRQTKSLFVGFCALAVLYDRPTELLSVTEISHLKKIKVMMQHSFYLPDVMEFLERIHFEIFRQMGPAFCENPFAFEVSFRVYLNEIAWFVVARDEVRRAPSQIAIEAFVMT